MKRKCQQIALTRKRTAKLAFSMVELLVVVGIMSLLVTVAMVNMKGFNQAGNITAGGNQIVDLANQARQLAASRNVKTALVIIKSSSADSASDLTQAKIGLRTFCVMQYYAAPGTTTPTWQMATRWETLPASVTFDGSNANSSFLTTPVFQNPITTVTNRGRQYTATQIAYQIFNPEGGMELGTGVTSSYSSNQTLRVVATKTDSSALNYYDIYFNIFTGGTKVVRPEDKQ